MQFAEVVVNVPIRRTYSRRLDVRRLICLATIQLGAAGS